jgi:hypothetical protein
MGNIRTFFLPLAAGSLLFFFATHAWAGDKISVVQYGLKPVEAVKSGRFIKTEWNAKLRNGASELVKFTVTIVFVDSADEILKEATSQHELQAHETKTFQDTVLVKMEIAKRIATTRVKIDEISDTEAASP